MNERRRPPPAPAARPAAPAEVRWIPCPTCWGQRQILEPEPVPGGERCVLVAHPCPGCLGIGEVMVCEPAELAVHGDHPAAGGIPEEAGRAPGRTARRAGAALGCALMAGIAIGLVAPPTAAAAIAALVGVFCHLCLGGR